MRILLKRGVNGGAGLPGTPWTTTTITVLPLGFTESYTEEGERGFMGKNQNARGRSPWRLNAMYTAVSRRITDPVLPCGQTAGFPTLRLAYGTLSSGARVSPNALPAESDGRWFLQVSPQAQVFRLVCVQAFEFTRWLTPGQLQTAKLQVTLHLVAAAAPRLSTRILPSPALTARPMMTSQELSNFASSAEQRMNLQLLVGFAHSCLNPATYSIPFRIPPAVLDGACTLRR